MIQLQMNDAACSKHSAKVKPFLLKRIGSILTRGIKRDKSAVTLGAQFTALLNKWQKDEHLERLITAKPAELPVIIEELANECPAISMIDTDENFVARNIFIKHCYNIGDAFSKREFIRVVNTDVCPYCNRQYIYVLDKAHRIKPQIDHFYSQSEFPFLGVSFYNLIPSCGICNGLDVKNNLNPNKAQLTNPYSITDADFVFSCKYESAGVLQPKPGPESIELTVTSNCPGNLSVFKLQELYDQHKDHVVELIFKSEVQYGPATRKLFKEYCERHGLPYSPHEIDRMVMSNYVSQEQLSKRPLAKLYMDIGRQLKLIH